jgi:hypothetical protein
VIDRLTSRSAGFTSSITEDHEEGADPSQPIRGSVKIGLPMGVESFVGAAAGGAFAGTTSAEVLKLLLGVISLPPSRRSGGMGELLYFVCRGSFWNPTRSYGKSPRAAIS